MLEKRRFWKERWKTGRETKHRLGKNATELFYLSVGRQPAWLRLRSLASYRSTHAGRKEEEARRGSEVQARPGPSPFSSAVQWFGERRKNASIGCASVQQQQRHKRRALLTRQPLFSSSLLPFSRAPDHARPSALFPRYDSFSLSLDGVSRERPAPLAVGRAIIQ